MSYTSAHAQTNEGEAKTTSQSSTTIGGYGEISYIEPEGSTPGVFDLPRFVIFLSHQFNDKWSLKSETEIEHVRVEGGVGEIALEQAFLDYHASNAIGWRVGLMLIPVGIINLTHEPNTYYSVQRPFFDNDVIPTTWREMGTGIYGDITEGLKYQFYLSEGLRGEGFGFDEGIREGRQEGTSSNPIHPAVSGRLEYLPIAGLRIGGSFYYQAVTSPVASFDAPLSLFSLDARYEISGLKLRGEFASLSVKDAAKLTALPRQTEEGETTLEPVLSKATGGYLEAGYDIMSAINSNNDEQLIPFVRYETYKMETETANSGLTKNYITAGVAFKPLDNLILKVDWTSPSFKQDGTTEDETSEHNGIFAIGAGYSF